MDERKPYLTPNEVAELMMVSPITVRQWAQKGLLNATTTAGGHRRFLREEVERFAGTHGLKFPDSPGANGTRILVVDDDRQLAGYIRELLSDVTELQVEIAFDGYEAGMKVLRMRPNIVLLDLMMPGLDGFEVTRRIKSDPETRHIRVLTMTGFRTSANVGLALAAGAEICLAKPLDAKLLLTEIKKSSLP